MTCCLQMVAGSRFDPANGREMFQETLPCMFESRHASAGYADENLAELLAKT